MSDANVYAFGHDRLHLRVLCAKFNDLCPLFGRFGIIPNKHIRINVLKVMRERLPGVVDAPTRERYNGCLLAKYRFTFIINSSMP